MEYQELKEKYDLPAEKAMDKEYDISSLDDFTLKEIINKMEDKLEFLSNVLEEILQPSPESLANLHECRHFSQEDKGEIYVLFKKIQFYLRAVIEAKVRNEAQFYTQIILEIFQVYPELKHKAVPFVQKLKDSWNLNDESKEYAEYFG